MKRVLACLATLAFAASASASAAQSPPSDPIGDLISTLSQPGAQIATGSGGWSLRATLYHGGKGIRARDSLGCPVSAMRTVAVDPNVVGRRAIIFIRETVGLQLPRGGVHDGYWYASDVGGAIKGNRIDLFTGHGAASMGPLRDLNLKNLTVSKVGEFSGCPPIDGGEGARVAAAE